MFRGEYSLRSTETVQILSRSRGAKVRKRPDFTGCKRGSFSHRCNEGYGKKLNSFKGGASRPGDVWLGVMPIVLAGGSFREGKPLDLDYLRQLDKSS